MLLHFFTKEQLAALSPRLVPGTPTGLVSTTHYSVQTAHQPTRKLAVAAPLAYTPWQQLVSCLPGSSSLSPAYALPGDKSS